MNTKDITNTIKNGDKVIMIDGYGETEGKVYGIKLGKFGYSIRIKIEKDGNTEFDTVSKIYENMPFHIRPIGVYKVA